MTGRPTEEDAQSECAVGRSQLVARDAVTTRVRVHGRRRVVRGRRVHGRRHDERAADRRRLRQLVHEPRSAEFDGLRN